MTRLLPDAHQLDACLLLHSNESVILADAGPGVQTMVGRTYVCDDSFVGTHVLVPQQSRAPDEMLWITVGKDVVFSWPLQALMSAYERAPDIARAGVRVRRPILVPPRQAILVATSERSRVTLFLRGIRRVADLRFGPVARAKI